MPLIGTRDHSAAANGLMSRTDCRYWVAKMANPTTANIDTRFSTTAPVKPRLRNSRRSIIGARLRACLATNTMPATVPPAIAATHAASTPAAAICCIP